MACTHVIGVAVDDEGLVLFVCEKLRRVADVDGGLLLVARQNLESKTQESYQILHSIAAIQISPLKVTPVIVTIWIQ